MVEFHHGKLHALTLTWMDNYPHFLNSGTETRNVTTYVSQSFDMLVSEAMIWLYVPFP